MMALRRLASQHLTCSFLTLATHDMAHKPRPEHGAPGPGMLFALHQVRELVAASLGELKESKINLVGSFGDNEKFLHILV